MKKILIEIVVGYCCMSALIMGNIRPVGAEIAFQDRTASAGLTTLLKGGYGSSWVDFNDDGWLDVWISNHMYQPSLYINNGDGTFSERLSEFWQGNPLLDAHGGAWADFDNDGDQDLVELYGVLRGSTNIQKPFYVNQGGMLTDEADIRGLNDVTGRGRTPLWLDWNNDGLLDLYMANYPRADSTLGPTRLMLQQEDGSFVPLPEMTQHIKSFFGQLAYFDSAVHLVIGSPASIIYPKQFYRLGSTTPLPVLPQPNLTFFGLEDVAVADFDGDLSDDMLVLRNPSEVNSWLLDPTTRRRVLVDVHNLSLSTTGSLNFWFKGPSRLTFRLHGFNNSWTPEMIRVGAAGSVVAKSAFDFVDGRQWKHIELTLDVNDPVMGGILPVNLRTTPGIYIGWSPSLEQWRVEVRGTADFQAEFVSNDAEFTKWASDGREIWTNFSGNVPIVLSRRDGEFYVNNLGLNEVVTCGSVAVGDFDNDMDIDAYLACGNGIRNTVNILFENVNGTFVRVPGAGGAGTQNIGTSGRVSVADYDNDGYLDLLVTDGGKHDYPFQFGRRSLLHNKGGSNFWLKIALEGCQSNRDGIGARVLVQAGGHKQARLRAGGIRNGVQDDPRLHFGLAQNTFAESVIVEWPSGARKTRTNLAAGRTYTIREDANCLRP